MIKLVRHGETDDNREPIRVQGQLAVPLNERGVKQSAELADSLRSEPPAVIYTSTLLRACETAELIGKQLGLIPIPDDRLAESFRGEWEGQLLAEIERDDPVAYAAWRAAGERFRFPGGESLLEQQRRVVAALEAIADEQKSPALVVCHGGSIRVALCHFHGRGLEAFHEWDVPNGAVIELP